MVLGLKKKDPSPKKAVNPLATGVMIGSITALAGTPAGEVRTLVLSLCETMPPDAFKQFVIRIAKGLGPGVHRTLVARGVGGPPGGWGNSALKSVLPSKAAKALVLGWLDRYEPEALEVWVADLVSSMPEETIASILPVALAWAALQSEQLQTIDPHATGPAAPPVEKQPGNATGQPGPKPSLWSKVNSLWGARNTSLVANSERAKASPSLAEVRNAICELGAKETYGLLLQLQLDIVRGLDPAMVEEEGNTLVSGGEVLASFQGAATSMAAALPTTILVAQLPRWAKLRLLAAEGLVLPPQPSLMPDAVLDTLTLLNLGKLEAKQLADLPRNDQEAHGLLAAIVAATALSGNKLKPDNTGLMAHNLQAHSPAGQSHALAPSQQLLLNRTEGGAAPSFQAVPLEGQPAKVGAAWDRQAQEGSAGGLAAPLGSTVAALFERLPPSFVADQLADIVETIPPDTLSDEVKSLVVALPPNALSELAERVADALPAAALRGLVEQIVGPYRSKASQASASTPGTAAIPADTADLAGEVAVHCGEETLRRVVAELLENIPPYALKERLERFVDSLGPTKLKEKILQLLRKWSERSTRFASFAEMREAKDAADRAAHQEAMTKKLIAEMDSGIVLGTPLLPKRRGLVATARSALGRVNNGRKARLLRNVVVKIPADVLATKVFETAAQLPPESFVGLAQDVAHTSWNLLAQRVKSDRNTRAAVAVASSAGTVAGGAVASSATLAKGGTIAGLAGAGKGATLGATVAGGTIAGGGALAKGAGVVALAAGAMASSAGTGTVDDLLSTTGEKLLPLWAQSVDTWSWIEDIEASVLVTAVVGGAAVAAYLTDPRNRGLEGAFEVSESLLKRVRLAMRRDAQLSTRLLLSLARTSPACRSIIYPEARAALERNQAETDARSELGS